MEVKSRATKCFKEGEYNQALELYTQAVEIAPEAVLFSNQALCNLKLGNWDEVVNNCDQAIRLDSNAVKAFFLKGQALTELEKFDAAIVCLKTAHSLSKELRRNFGDDITSSIRLAKRKRWNALQEKKVEQRFRTETMVFDLLEERKIMRKEFTDHSSEKTEVELEYERSLGDIREIFSKAREDHVREVPEFLCGKISFEIMTDPVITSSGITYNRQDIEDHLQRVGHFDPITRQPLTCDQLIPNLAMKEVIDAFVQNNEWVEEY